MKTLILGASGYIGNRIYARLCATDWANPVCASRRRSGSQRAFVVVDVRDPDALTQQLKTGQYDCVINCVAGDFESIASGARALASAAEASGCGRIVHLSSMSVYGRAEGLVDEQTPFDAGLGWYARAKCEAERQLERYAQNGGELVILRPGCVFGAGSELWVGRVFRWLRSGRLGDVGAAGDGWSNLVHLDDVCEAVLRAMQLQLVPGARAAFNLAGPDSPRWNQYFVDLAVLAGVVPVRTISGRQLKIDSLAAAAPLKLAERLLDKLGVRHPWLPEPIPPSLVGLFGRQLRLAVQSASQQLELDWKPYRASLDDCSHWLGQRVFEPPFR